MIKYPAQIDDSISLPTQTDNLSPVKAETVNNLRNAILAVENELGIKPSSTYGTVRGRLDSLESTVGNLKVISLAKDIGNTLALPFVVGLQGRPISAAAPLTGFNLTWSGIAWTPTPGKNTIDALQPPFMLTLNPFTILLEVSQTIINPSFSADYSYLPALGLTLNDNVNNTFQNVISTPNSFASVYTFIKNSFGGNVIFTLTGTTDTVIKSAVNVINWGQKLYWGVGTAGGNTSGFITALGNNQITLNRVKTFATTSNPGLKIYFACRTAYGTPTFARNSVPGGFNGGTVISVTNSFGFTENYTLYESTADATVASTITVI